jgi:uncharacterized protein
MNCPDNHKSHMEKILFHNVEADYCPECLGMWFDKDEFRLAKDDKDQQLNWIDFDVWRDKGRFKVVTGQRRCPVCRIPMSQVHYDDSKVKIDFCKHCEGIWLDRGEFKQIIVYLKRKADYEILHHYIKTLSKQLWEVFTGPETLREELYDFLMVIKLFSYKFVVQYPFLNAWIENSQK